MESRPKIIVILGPTASGKSALAANIAKRFNGEIISADSRQVYRGMDLGAGKVPRDPHPRVSYVLNPKFFFHHGIPHHLLDVASPARTFTAARYQKLGTKAIREILSRGHLPVIAGGTGLYIDALIYRTPLPDTPPNAAFRKKLENRSAAELFARLKKLDPARANHIDRHNRRRLVRALEIVVATGKPVPSLQEKTSPYETLKIGVFPGKDALEKRIRTRLLARLRAGMIAEVNKLRNEGLSWQRLDDFGLEYRHVSRYCRGVLTKKEMIALLENEIRHYAKRQMTWFKRDKKIFWISGAGDLEKASARIYSFLKNKSLTRARRVPA